MLDEIALAVKLEDEEVAHRLLRVAIPSDIILCLDSSLADRYGRANEATDIDVSLGIYSRAPEVTTCRCTITIVSSIRHWFMIYFKSLVILNLSRCTYLYKDRHDLAMRRPFRGIFPHSDKLGLHLYVVRCAVSLNKT